MLKKGVLMVDLWTLQLIRSCLSYTMLSGCCILEGTSQEIYCWIGVDYAAVGLNLLKESEVSAPQPEYIFIHFLFILFFNCNYCNLWYITPTISTNILGCVHWNCLLISQTNEVTCKINSLFLFLLSLLLLYQQDHDTRLVILVQRQ